MFDEWHPLDEPLSLLPFADTPPHIFHASITQTYTRTCLAAPYKCFTSGTRLMNHSPSARVHSPIQDEKKTPVLVINTWGVLRV